MPHGKETNKEPEAIWDYIRYLREKKGYSLATFAALIECSFVHAARIEKPYHVTHNSASPKLLKRIAAVCGADEQSRDILVKKLMMKRARIFYSGDIVDDVFSKPAVNSRSYGEGMPVEFIERLRHDSQATARENIFPKLSITPETLREVLEGRFVLSARSVASVARKLRQPVDEYLLLAGYTNQGIRRLFSNQHFLELMKKAEKFSPEEIDKLGIAVGSMLSLLKKSDDKKKEGC